MTDPGTALLLGSRFVQFASIMILAGGLWFPLYAGSELANGRVAASFDRWQFPILLSATALCLFSSIAWLSAEAALMSDDWGRAFDGATMSTVLLQTEFGRIWMVHLALVAIMIILLPLLRGRRSVPVRVLLAAAAAALVATAAGAGHALAADGTMVATQLAMATIHLLGASLWIGGLVPLGYILIMAARHGQDWSGAAISALAGFSRSAFVAVALIVGSGSLIGWSLVGSWGGLVETPYGRLLMVKVALVLVMIALALANRLLLVPRLPTQGAQNRGSRLAVVCLARNVIAEMVLGVMVLAVVSVLGTLPPGDGAAPDMARATAPPSAAAEMGSSDVHRQGALPAPPRPWEIRGSA